MIPALLLIVGGIVTVTRLPRIRTPWPLMILACACIWLGVAWFAYEIVP
jgi:hypothetical protein